MSDHSPAALARHLAAAFAVPAEMVEELADLHHRQWNLEDLARQPGASADRIAAAKAEIDASNTTRHRLIDSIDAHATVAISGLPGRYYSETIGELCDRLLILDLKHRALAALPSLDRPADSGEPAGLHGVTAVCRHLSAVIGQLLEDVAEGRAELPPRVGVKVYNGSTTDDAAVTSNPLVRPSSAAGG